MAATTAAASALAILPDFVRAQSFVRRRHVRVLPVLRRRRRQSPRWTIGVRIGLVVIIVGVIAFCTLAFKLGLSVRLDGKVEKHNFRVLHPHYAVTRGSQDDVDTSITVQAVTTDVSNAKDGGGDRTATRRVGSVSSVDCQLVDAVLDAWSLMVWLIDDDGGEKCFLTAANAVIQCSVDVVKSRDGYVIVHTVYLNSTSVVKVVPILEPLALHFAPDSKWLGVVLSSGVICQFDHWKTGNASTAHRNEV